MEGATGKERATENLGSAGSIPSWPQCPRLSHAEAKSQELHLSFPAGSGFYALGLSAAVFSVTLDGY